MKLRRVLVCLTVLLGFSFLGCDSGNNVTSRDGAVSGIVVDTAGRPLRGAQITWLGDQNKFSTTDASGSFLIDEVSFGDQSFFIEKSGYRPRTFTVAIYSGAITALKKIVVENASFEYLDLKIAEFSGTHALITWKTTDYTNGVVEYGETEGFGRSVREPDKQFATVHSVTLPDLKPQTRYYCRVVASRENRPAETSVRLDFTTLATLDDRTPPASPRGVGIALTEQPNQVTIFWNPNTDADLKGYRIYRSELPSAGFTSVGNLIVPKGSERYVDAGAITGKKFHYRVSAVDLAGNEGSASEIVAMLVPGDLTRDITWTRSNSPYLLAGDIDIQNNGVLRIDPGVEIRMADYDALKRGDPARVEIRVQGSLIAANAGFEPIVFTSDRALPAAGDWGGISFMQSPPDLCRLENLNIAFAKTGLTVYATRPTLNQVTVSSCEVGVIASASIDLKIASSTFERCPTGILLTGNTRPSVLGCRFRSCDRGLDSQGNDGATYIGNDFLEYSDYGLTAAEKSGEVRLENNLFVSSVGLGLHLVDLVAKVAYNTFDSPYGIRIDRNNPKIEKNILVTSRSLTGQGIKGIEHLALVEPLPVFGPNDLFGFPAGKDHVGCASSAGSLASAPHFMKDENGATYDYRLREGFPGADDPWGIRREVSP